MLLTNNFFQEDLSDLSVEEDKNLDLLCRIKPEGFINISRAEWENIFTVFYKLKFFL